MLSPQNQKKRAIFITGPTAAGKTAAVIKLAQQLPLAIISVDSSLIYQGMDIGTGKPTQEELALAPHALIDIIPPNQSYSVAEFSQVAVRLMHEALENHKIPVLVGGTMMYWRALQDGIATLPAADPALRSSLKAQLDQQGPQFLHQQLQQLDPIAAHRIHPNDPQRLQRALEIVLLTGKTTAELYTNHTAPLADWELQICAIAPTTRALLHERIATRFHAMLQQGLVAEVQQLQQQYNLDISMPAMRAVGYRQVCQYLQGELDYSTMVTKAITATRQLAKRQYTWLRSFSDVTWLDSDAATLGADLRQLILPK
jgi:tRNA dimethylallyltransferase